MAFTPCGAATALADVKAAIAGDESALEDLAGSMRTCVRLRDPLACGPTPLESPVP